VNDVMWDTRYVTLGRFNLEWLEKPNGGQQ
jgi:hypothetical protein